MRAVNAETLPDYTINVHGIKGASANIGAEKIRETAASLEVAAKAGDLSGVLARNATFLKDLENVLAGIRAWLKSQESQEAKPQRPAPDPTLLANLRRSCERFDLSSSTKILTDLESANYEKDAELITWLREKIDSLDFPEVAERLAKYQEQA
jgi:HPt (histidine-containing phosphotransfer) domain-containing protein